MYYSGVPYFRKLPFSAFSTNPLKRVSGVYKGWWASQGSGGLCGLVEGLEFRVEGLGFRVEGLGFRVSGGCKARAKKQSEAFQSLHAPEPVSCFQPCH